MKDNVKKKRNIKNKEIFDREVWKEKIIIIIIILDRKELCIHRKIANLVSYLNKDLMKSLHGLLLATSGLQVRYYDRTYKPDFNFSFWDFGHVSPPFRIM
jgi:hypothetical protein